MYSYTFLKHQYGYRLKPTYWFYHILWFAVMILFFIYTILLVWLNWKFECFFGLIPLLFLLNVCFFFDCLSLYFGDSWRLLGLFSSLRVCFMFWSLGFVHVWVCALRCLCFLLFSFHLFEHLFYMFFSSFFDCRQIHISPRWLGPTARTILQDSS